MSRLGTYIDTLELENEMLRNKVKKLESQLKPYIDAENKRKEYLEKRDAIDAKLAQMMANFHNQNK